MHRTRLVAALFVLLSTNAMAERNLLQPGTWAPKQPWQSQGECWGMVKEGDASFVRLMKNPVVVQQTIDTDGSFAKVKPASDVRLSNLQTDGRWGVVIMALIATDVFDRMTAIRDEAICRRTNGTSSASIPDQQDVDGRAQS